MFQLFVLNVLLTYDFYKLRTNLTSSWIYFRTPSIWLCDKILIGI